MSFFIILYLYMYNTIQILVLKLLTNCSIAVVLKEVSWWGYLICSSAHHLEITVGHLVTVRWPPELSLKVRSNQTKPGSCHYDTVTRWNDMLLIVKKKEKGGPSLWSEIETGILGFFLPIHTLCKVLKILGLFISITSFISIFASVRLDIGMEF